MRKMLLWFFIMTSGFLNLHFLNTTNINLQIYIFEEITEVFISQ